MPITVNGGTYLSEEECIKFLMKRRKISRDEAELLFEEFKEAHPEARIELDA